MGNVCGGGDGRRGGETNFDCEYIASQSHTHIQHTHIGIVQTMRNILFRFFIFRCCRQDSASLFFGTLSQCPKHVDVRRTYGAVLRTTKLFLKHWAHVRASRSGHNRSTQDIRRERDISVWCTGTRSRSRVVDKKTCTQLKDTHVKNFVMALHSLNAVQYSRFVFVLRLVFAVHSCMWAASSSILR